MYNTIILLSVLLKRLYLPSVSDKRSALSQLSQQLRYLIVCIMYNNYLPVNINSISTERHHVEVRRAIYDEELAAIASRYAV